MQDEIVQASSWPCETFCVACNTVTFLTLTRFSTCVARHLVCRERDLNYGLVHRG